MHEDTPEYRSRFSLAHADFTSKQHHIIRSLIIRNLITGYHLSSDRGGGQKKIENVLPRPARASRFFPDASKFSFKHSSQKALILFRSGALLSVPMARKRSHLDDSSDESKSQGHGSRSYAVRQHYLFTILW